MVRLHTTGACSSSSPARDTHVQISAQRNAFRHGGEKAEEVDSGISGTSRSLDERASTRPPGWRQSPLRGGKGAPGTVRIRCVRDNSIPLHCENLLHGENVNQ